MRRESDIGSLYDTTGHGKLYLNLLPRGGGLGGIYFPTTWHIVAKHYMVRCDTKMVRHNTRVSRLPPHLHTFYIHLRVSTESIGVPINVRELKSGVTFCIENE